LHPHTIFAVFLNIAVIGGLCDVYSPICDFDHRLYGEKLLFYTRSETLAVDDRFEL
jgi:hypothetical protein